MRLACDPHITRSRSVRDEREPFFMPDGQERNMKEILRELFRNYTNIIVFMGAGIAFDDVVA
jgi:hypothetical protein